MNPMSVNEDWMKMYVTESKNGIIMNVGVNVKNQMIEVLVKELYAKS